VDKENHKQKMGMIDTRRIPPSIEKIDPGRNPKIDAFFD
jgi:hypothetical protein